jgi:hypothetical protein
VCEAMTIRLSVVVRSLPRYRFPVLRPHLTARNVPLHEHFRHLPGSSICQLQPRVAKASSKADKKAMFMYVEVILTCKCKVN